MRTTETTSGISRHEIFQELFTELQIQRSGVHADKMAENLLLFEDGRNLVAVGPDAERAIYYELTSRSLVAVQFDKYGIYEGGQELLTGGSTTPQRGLDRMAMT